MNHQLRISMEMRQNGSWTTARWVFITDPTDNGRSKWDRRLFTSVSSALNIAKIFTDDGQVLCKSPHCSHQAFKSTASDDVCMHVSQKLSRNESEKLTNRNWMVSVAIKRRALLHISAFLSNCAFVLGSGRGPCRYRWEMSRQCRREALNLAII